MDLSSVDLRTVRLGPLPIINHFLAQLNVEPLLDSFVPTRDKRVCIPYARVLAVLLRSFLADRAAIYSLPESVVAYGAEGYGLNEDEIEHLCDDRVGRALDHLFSADRGTLLTTLAVGAVKQYGVSLEEIHSDTTSISFCGNYESAVGRNVRGRRAPRVTHGHSKDHRRDLKQLLFEISVSRDGAVPVQFRCADGNTNDDLLHIQTWDTLRKIAGQSDFLYVADAKLCSGDNMNHIDGNGGRFVTVLPHNRLEYKEFEEWITHHDPDWIEVWNRPNPRQKDGPRDIWRVFRYPVPSRDGWPVTWVQTSLSRLTQQTSRRERIAVAVRELDELSKKLTGPRCRIRTTYDLNKRVQQILSHYNVEPYITVSSTETPVGAYVQITPGRASARTHFRRDPKAQLSIEWSINTEAILRDKKMDGVYPLLTNDSTLTPAQVLEAHKAQPQIEKRFQQLKSVYEIAPVFLKNEARIEAFFTVFFMAMLVQAIIERQLRIAMQREQLGSLPIYPEGRQCRSPTSDQIFRLFLHTERHHLYQQDTMVKTFEPNLSELQLSILRLLGMSQSQYWSKR